MVKFGKFGAPLPTRRGTGGSAILGRTLREHESELKAAGIEHLFLHGSSARGTAIREFKEPVAAKASREAVLAF